MFTNCLHSTARPVRVIVRPKRYERFGSHFSRRCNLPADPKTQPHSSRTFCDLASPLHHLAWIHPHYSPLTTIGRLGHSFRQSMETTLHKLIIVSLQSPVTLPRNYTQLYTAIVSRAFKHLKDCIQREFRTIVDCFTGANVILA
jgi:hypothetical protein